MWTHRSHSRRRRRQESIETAVSGAAFFTLGMVAMYFFDPTQGNRRRAILRDKALSLLGRTRVRIVRQAHRAGDHARGLVAETRARFRHEELDDHTLAERVRACLGRAVSHPGAIYVTSDDGVVSLHGQVPARELKSLLRHVARVRGVREVHDHLEIVESPTRWPAPHSESLPRL